MPYTPPAHPKPTKLVPRYTLADLLADAPGDESDGVTGLEGLDLSAYLMDTA